MKNTIKKILKRIIFSKPGNKIEQQNSITFPGGLFPIQETKPEDVFIVGFPKSGNTLMQHIITHLVYGVNDEVSRSIVNLITPDIYANTHYFRFNNVCFFKSHERPQPNYKKVIYLIRDGREALLSYYHMVKNMGGDISLNDLYEGKINIYGGSWHEHVNEWEKNPYKADILFVKYEDLIANKIEVLLRLCDFLSLKRTSQKLEKVLEFSSFEFMKKLERKDDWVRMKKKTNLNKGSFVRKGVINSYKDEVPTDVLNVFKTKSINNFYKF
jgi:hypothetical protein